MIWWTVDMDTLIEALQNAKFNGCRSVVVCFEGEANGHKVYVEGEPVTVSAVTANERYAKIAVVPADVEMEV